ncbi:MAG: hypothetical protein JXR52_12660 [Bacteroidales bacterium]|nr:hypothetical protein [Bacteroidales bacterium]MBN2699670.1 hypothetical protein [Bacteroidales bacterium]
MKTIRNLLIGVIAVFLASCATTAKFPVSDVLPAAEITAKKKQDKNENSEITIKAKHLAGPERLNPPKKFYVVWINTDNGLINIGQLLNTKSNSAELKTVTPYKFKDIIITAEDTGNLTRPEGFTIARTAL